MRGRISVSTHMRVSAGACVCVRARHQPEPGPGRHRRVHSNRCRHGGRVRHIFPCAWHGRTSYLRVRASVHECVCLERGGALLYAHSAKEVGHPVRRLAVRHPFADGSVSGSPTNLSRHRRRLYGIADGSVSASPTACLAHIHAGTRFDRLGRVASETACLHGCLCARTPIARKTSAIW